MENDHRGSVDRLRRRLAQGAGAGLFVTGLNSLLPLPAWALKGPGAISEGIGAYPAGRHFDLAIAYAPLEIDGRTGRATAINGTVPGPLIRWREGDEVQLNVSNGLMDTDHISIHWHGILVPFPMDGVPGVNFKGIAPGETYPYRFRVKQAGTYWYHSHSAFQEQTGTYGPLIIDPREGEPFQYDRDHVIVLSDWSFESPDTIFRNLHKVEGYYNFQRLTLFDLLRQMEAEGNEAALRDRLAWDKMRMSPVDLLDVTGATYTYLINGHSPDMNWTGRFLPGETVRLRVINASAMSIMDVRIPGLEMAVVMADGKAVKPVTVGEFRIGVAETYDVLVRPRDEKAYTLFAEALDRSGYARATLAPEAGMEAPVPPSRPRPVRSLEAIGMGGMDRMLFGGGDKMGGMDHGDMGHGGGKAGDMRGMQDMRGKMPEHLHENPAVPGPAGPEPFRPEPGNPQVAMVINNPRDRLDEPGLGLGEDGWRVLTYADLENAEGQPYPATVDRELSINLTANMERYQFSFDGRQFSDHPGPYLFRHNERLRLYMVNHTMMDHPIHIHGMWMQLENGRGPDAIPFKHTVLVKPGEKLSVLITPIEKGDWAFHCHLLYHMEAGMFQVVRVE